MKSYTKDEIRIKWKELLNDPDLIWLCEIVGS